MTRHGKAIAASSLGEGTSSRIADPVPSGSDQPSGGSQDTETTFAGEAVGQIEAVIESFRTGKTKKSQAIYKTSQILANDPNGDEQLKSDSFERYVSTIEGIEAFAARSNEHGLRFVEPITGKRKEDIVRGSQRHEAIDGNNDRDSPPIDVDGFLEGFPKGRDYDERGSDSGQGSDDDELDLQPLPFVYHF